LVLAVGKSALFRSKHSPRKQIDVIDPTDPHARLGAGKAACRCSNTLSGETEQGDVCRIWPSQRAGDTHRDYFLMSEKY
jgi:hypothetical protein